MQKTYCGGEKVSAFFQTSQSSFSPPSLSQEPSKLSGLPKASSSTCFIRNFVQQKGFTVFNVYSRAAAVGLINSSDTDCVRWKYSTHSRHQCCYLCSRHGHLPVHPPSSSSLLLSTSIYRVGSSALLPAPALISIPGLS